MYTRGGGSSVPVAAFMGIEESARESVGGILRVGEAVVLGY
jgi:hypothetical protein